MDRRTFLLLTGVGALVGSSPIFFKARSEQAAAATAIAQAANFQAVGNLNQLRTAQDQIRARISGTPVVVIRHPGSNGGVVAFNRRCPHEGCRVDWNGNVNAFVCPCHGAQFNASGSVTRGPARRPLQSLPVRVQGDQILVQIPNNQQAGLDQEDNMA
ncbi:MAG TPA: Rieske (2Fe-2S) protein [Crinalium sp.]|jgi:cytochrome b6-f complex iron-sulfur subunit